MPLPIAWQGGGPGRRRAWPLTAIGASEARTAIGQPAGATLRRLIHWRGALNCGGVCVACARVVGHEGMEARMRPFHLVWTRGCESSHRSAAPQGFQPGGLPLATEVPDPDWFGMAGWLNPSERDSKG
jgi:hypothetical protein